MSEGWQTRIEFPGTDRFTVLMVVSKVMEKRFTKEELLLAAHVQFFAALAADDNLRNLEPIEQLNVAWVSMLSTDYRMIRVHARIKEPTNQEGSSAQAQAE